MDKLLILSYVAFVIVLTSIIAGGYLIFEETKKEYRLRNRECENLLNQDCPDVLHEHHIICIKDCKTLNMDYFRYDSGGFGSQECWCLDDNKPIQIW